MSAPLRGRSAIAKVWDLLFVDSDGGCYEWGGHLSPAGYGQVKCPVARRSVYVHRVVYEEMVGPIPAGYTIDHLCRNPRCAKPEHLEAVTEQENILRGTSPMAYQARRTHCIAGHPFDEINTYRTPDGRRQCRTCRRIAERFGRRRRKRAA